MLLYRPELSVDPKETPACRPSGGVHLEWDDNTIPPDKKDIAIGWAELGDLRALPPSRDGFKQAFARLYPNEKPGAVPGEGRRSLPLHP